MKKNIKKNIKKKKDNRKDNRKGITLYTLVITVIVLVMLSVIVIRQTFITNNPVYDESKSIVEDAQMSELKQNIRNLLMELEINGQNTYVGSYSFFDVITSSSNPQINVYGTRKQAERIKLDDSKYKEYVVIRERHMRIYLNLGTEEYNTHLKDNVNEIVYYFALDEIIKGKEYVD